MSFSLTLHNNTDILRYVILITQNKQGISFELKKGERDNKDAFDYNCEFAIIPWTEGSRWK